MIVKNLRFGKFEVQIFWDVRHNTTKLLFRFVEKPNSFLKTISQMILPKCEAKAKIFLHSFRVHLNFCFIIHRFILVVKRSRLDHLKTQCIGIVIFSWKKKFLYVFLSST